MSTRRTALIGRSMPICPQKTRARAEGGSQKSHYKPLPKEFWRDGFHYRQVAREGDIALYEQRWTGCPDATVCFEVIRVRQREGFEIGGRFVSPAKVYPRSEQWGELGWTVDDKESAFHKLREVVASLEKSPT